MEAATATPPVNSKPVIPVDSVPVTIQQSAVPPILSPVSFRYALIQPSITEIKNHAPVAQPFDQTRESIRC